MSDKESFSTNFMDEFGGSFVNLILGGMLLWVGQTTFEHNGELAGFRQQLDSLNQRHDALLERYDRVNEAINERTRSRFTAEDGEKLSQRIKAVEMTEAALNDRLHERLGELRVQLSALQAQMQASLLAPPVSNGYSPLGAIREEVNRIHQDVERLNNAVRQATDVPADTANLPAVRVSDSENARPIR